MTRPFMTQVCFLLQSMQSIFVNYYKLFSNVLERQDRALSNKTVINHNLKIVSHIIQYCTEEKNQQPLCLNIITERFRQKWKRVGKDGAIICAHPDDQTYIYSDTTYQRCKFIICKRMRTGSNNLVCMFVFSRPRRIVVYNAHVIE